MSCRGRIAHISSIAPESCGEEAPAEREGVADRYVRRLMRLGFLAPEIVEAIAAGNQLPELTAEALAERIDLPLLWTAQEQAVGIA